MTRDRSRSGFAGMDPEKRREIARKGGRAAAATGKAHRFTPATASEAGRRGGLASAAARRAERAAAEGGEGT